MDLARTGYNGQVTLVQASTCCLQVPKPGKVGSYMHSMHLASILPRKPAFPACFSIRVSRLSIIGHLRVGVLFHELILRLICRHLLWGSLRRRWSHFLDHLGVKVLGLLHTLGIIL